MARPRKPLALAEITGSTLSHPERYRDRAEPATQPLGEPYERMTPRQKELWAECAEEFPWARRSDRMQLRMLCQLLEKEERHGVDFPAQNIRMIMKILNSFGGTPTSPLRRRMG